jgi:hypothetical protein
MLGLFAAADGGNDDVTLFSPYRTARAPTPRAVEKAAEFLMTVTLVVPPGTAAQMVEDTEAREAQAAHDLVG